MPHGTAAEAGASLLVQSLLVGWTVPCYVSLLPTVETVSEHVLFLLALFVGVVLGAAFVAEASLGCRALVQQMLSGSALEAPLLMALLVLQLT
jgi:hypothetical protein